jgi:hypothetical protein
MKPTFLNRLLLPPPEPSLIAKSKMGRKMRQTPLRGAILCYARTLWQHALHPQVHACF